MHPVTSSSPKWGLNIRILHWIIACTVSFHLFSSLFMADRGTQFLFPVHEFVGLIAAGCIAGFWWLSFTNHDMHILLPWIRSGLRTVLQDIGN